MDTVSSPAREPPGSVSVVRCPLCDSTAVTFTEEARHAGIASPYRYHRCRACTAHFVWPQPSEAELTALYDRLYYGHASDGASQADLVSYADRLAVLERLLGHRGRLLDVGSGTGLFLEAARDRGWQPLGVEISPFGVRRSRERGLEVVEGFMESVELEPASLDAIHAWAVFEHLRDPVAFLRKAHALLRPGGILALHTINMGSLNARYYGSDWECRQDTGHLFFPTERSMRMLFERAGFEVLERRIGGNPVGINRLSATNNARGIKSPAAKRALLGLKGRVLGSPTLRRVAKRAIQVLRLGDVFTFYVRKPT